MLLRNSFAFGMFSLLYLRSTASPPYFAYGKIHLPLLRGGLLVHPCIRLPLVRGAVSSADWGDCSYPLDISYIPSGLASLRPPPLAKGRLSISSSSTPSRPRKLHIAFSSHARKERSLRCSDSFTNEDSFHYKSFGFIIWLRIFSVSYKIKKHPNWGAFLLL